MNSGRIVISIGRGGGTQPGSKKLVAHTNNLSTRQGNYKAILSLVRASSIYTCGDPVHMYVEYSTTPIIALSPPPK